MPNTVSRTSKDDRGVALLLALFVMTGVVISSVGLSALILSSLQQSRVIDNAVLAYYAAESGVEQAIYEARMNDVLPAAVTSPQALTNGATWTRAVTDRESVLYPGSVAEDASVEIALYDPQASTTAQNIGRIHVSWTDDCGGCTVLQSTLVGWQSGSPVIWDPNADVRRQTWNASGVDIAVPDPSRLYRLRLRAENDSLQDVEVRAYTAANAATTLPGRVRVDSVGSYGTVRQRLTATMPRNVPLSGIFDFVIFSECSLVKGGAISCP